MSGPTHWYRAYGLRIRSAVALPFAPLAENPELPASEPDVTVRLGAVPETLPGGSVTHSPSSLVWQARPGAFLLHGEGVARYLVTGGRDVLIEPLSADDDTAALCLLNTPFAALLQQRGVTTLHAAAVATASGAVLLMGVSGIGKSSLAAALVERGYPLLTDDLACMVQHAGGRVMVFPTFPSQRLWADSLDAMGWRRRAQSRGRQGQNKYWIPAQRTCAAPLPAYAAFVLGVNDRRDIVLNPVPSGRAFFRLLDHSYRSKALQAMGQSSTLFHTLVAIARQVPVVRVTRPRHPFLLDALADRIEAYLRRAGPIRSPGTATPA